MPQDVTDSHIFTEPIVEMADSDPLDPAYVRTAIQGLANRTRKLWDAIDPSAVVSREWCVWPLADVPNASDWTLDLSTKAWTSAVNGGQIECPLPRLPAGAKITAIKVRVTPGAARSGTNKWHFALFHHGGVLGGQSQVGATTYDDGTTGSQTVTLSGLTEVVVEADYYFVRVTAGNTGASAPDVFSVVAVVFDDKTPRSP